MSNFKIDAGIKRKSIKCQYLNGYAMVSFRQPRNERHGFFLAGPIEKAHHFGACQYTIQSRKNKFVYQETKRTEARIKSFSRRETPPATEVFYAPCSK